MSVVTGVEFIGPGFKRSPDVIHRGFWTPQLGEWKEDSGYNEIRDLQFFEYSGSIKQTGSSVNACPILAIVKSEIGHNDLVVSVTGLLGELDTSWPVASGSYTISGFSTNYQYNEPIYRREFVTGGGTFLHEFTIPAYTKPGKVYTLPTKRVYRISNVSVSGQITDQPLAILGFYALADNGSKILHSMNWDKIFEYASKVLYSAYGNPKKCDRCNGSGYITVSSNTCQQCEGYGYHGPNATGFMLNKIGFDYGLVQDADDTDQKFRNKIWAMNWWVTPTKKEIQRYFAHFARIEDNEIEVDNVDRSSSSTLPTGIECLVDVKVPYNIPLGVFSNSDDIWEQMAKSVEPAGIDIRFSFLARSMTGYWTWDEWTSRYISGYLVSGNLSIAHPDPMTFGFYQPVVNWDLRFGQGWHQEWGEDWMWFNHLDIGSHDSGYISGCSGVAMISGATYTWINGSMTGAANEWLKWAWPSGGNADDDEWHTGGADDEITQEAFWISGTYKLDNFWASGGASGFVGTARVVSGIVY